VIKKEGSRGTGYITEKKENSFNQWGQNFHSSEGSDRQGRYIKMAFPRSVIGICQPPRTEGRSGRM